MQRQFENEDERCVSPPLLGYPVTDLKKEEEYLSRLEMRPQVESVVDPNGVIKHSKTKFLESHPSNEEKLTMERENFSFFALANYYFAKNNERDAVENAENYLVQADCTQEPALTLWVRLVSIYDSKATLYMKPDNRKKLIDKLHADGLLSIEDYNAIKKKFDYRHLACFFSNDATTIGSIGSPKEVQQRHKI